MEFLNVKIHPLFFAVGVASALVGGLPVFLITAITALLHECGHIFCAAKLGFNCTNVKLMPYGAAAVCDIDGISPADEIKLALSGPAVNAFLCVGVAGLWWFYPQSYAYTDTVMFANAAMLAVNLLPAYPLDGGRVFRCVLKKFVSERTAGIALRTVSLVVAAGFVAAFFTVYRHLSCLSMAAFLACSAFEKGAPASKLKYAGRAALKRGLPVKYVMADSSVTFKEALKHVDGSRFLVLQIYVDDFLEEVNQEELFEKLQTHSPYDRVLDGEYGRSDPPVVTQVPFGERAAEEPSEEAFR